MANILSHEVKRAREEAGVGAEVGPERTVDHMCDVRGGQIVVRKRLMVEKKFFCSRGHVFYFLSFIFLLFIFL